MVGVFLVLIGLLDVFFTVLHYDGFGFLSSRLYNSLFDVVRSLTRPLPRRHRALGLSMAAPLLRWGLPKDHPGSQTPWLPTLIIGLETLITYLDELFLSEELEDPPDPVPFETFEAAVECDKEPSDPWLGRFVQIESFMREIVRLEDRPDPEEAYERYKQWLPFAHRNRSFFEAAANDLGYELDELVREPGEMLF